LIACCDSSINYYSYSYSSDNLTLRSTFSASASGGAFLDSSLFLIARESNGIDLYEFDIF
jgi:hypothetical protein